MPINYVQKRRKWNMKLKKGRKIAAILLAAAIVSADFHGAGSLAYASQQESQREEAEYARTAEEIGRASCRERV